MADKIDPLSVGEIPELIELLYSETRRLPVLVISDTEDGKTALPPNTVARRIAGAAHIAHLTRDAARELNRLIGRRMSAFHGAMRLYQPGLTEQDEDPFAHPLWLYQAQPENSLLRQIANRVLPAAFLDISEEVFPRYAVVREIVGRIYLQAQPSTHSEPILQQLNIAQNQSIEHAEERDEWISLAQEEQDRRIETERELEILKTEISKLEAKIKSIEYLNKSKKYDINNEMKPERRIKSFDDIEDWAEEVLGDGVFIHQSALKDCRKNGDNNMLQKIEATLLIMIDHMTPARISGDASQKNTARKMLSEIGVDDSACFVDRDEAKRRPQYSVRYGQDTRVLYDHLKYGNGYNNANQFRIYYFWDNEKKRHVVGKMPSHLPNNLTS